IDGETLFTYSPLTGVEAGQSEVVALGGPADLIVFKGKYADRRRCFETWVLSARENARPAIFRNEGMAPPLPEIDEDGTELANDLRAHAFTALAASSNHNLAAIGAPILMVHGHNPLREMQATALVAYVPSAEEGERASKKLAPAEAKPGGQG